jgi:hypothetical protein
MEKAKARVKWDFPEFVATISGKGEIRTYKIAKTTKRTRKVLTRACTYPKHTPTWTICHAGTRTVPQEKGHS